ncbi:MAG: ATPase V [Spirochaetales bacterium]|nr:ATPase V [Spirochaetales bacterium]
MIVTEKMTYLTGVALEDDVKAVTEVLINLGILDLVNIRDVSPEFRDKLKTFPAEIAQSKLDGLIQKIHGLFHFYGIRLEALTPEHLECMAADDFEHLEGEFLTILGSVETERKKRNALEAERKQLEEIKRQIRTFGDIRSGLKAQSTYSFLSLRTGTIPSEQQEAFSAALEDFPSVLLKASEEDTPTPVLLLITMKKDDASLRSLLDRCGWVSAELPVGYGGESDELDGRLDEKVNSLRDEENLLDEEIRNRLMEKVSWIREALGKLTVTKLAERIHQDFSKTDRTALFSGWLPVREQTRLTEALESATAGRCYLEWTGEKEIRTETFTPPVKLRNPKMLLPFEKLVKNYAIPEYGTIDPTPFVAVSYVLMFGLMFGDAGHGLVLLVLGLLGTYLKKKQRKDSNLFQLITWCGGSAIAAGILFGSYFGFELLQPLWFPYHAVVGGLEVPGPVRSIFDILKITIYFGIGVLGTGLILNWINLCLKKRWFPLLFDKGGLVGGWIYAAGVYLAFYFVRHDYRQLPPASFLLPALALPFLLLAFKAPLERYLKARKGHKERMTALTPVIFFMEWLVEVLEISSGYLANTLSFMRVAGLGIAHVSLMSAFFQIAGMASGGKGYSTLGAVIILILGNILVIGLEGLSAGIQSLRLNYYEFFSKYFSGSGRAYNPLSLHMGDDANRKEVTT